MEQLCSVSYVTYWRLPSWVPEVLFANSLTQATELELESPANRHGVPPASGIHALGQSTSSQSLELASGCAWVCLRVCMNVCVTGEERERKGGRETERQSMQPIHESFFFFRESCNYSNGIKYWSPKSYFHNKFQIISLNQECFYYFEICHGLKQMLVHLWLKENPCILLWCPQQQRPNTLGW